MYVTINYIPPNHSLNTDPQWLRHFGRVSFALGIKLESNLLTIIGLSYDILGVILIWRFGLPEFIDRKGHIHIITEKIDEKEVEKAKTYDQVSRIGLMLLVGGFAYQILAVLFR